MVRTSIITLIVVIFGQCALGQTTRPVEKAPGSATVLVGGEPAAESPASQAWPKAVETLAKALSKGDGALAAEVLSSRAMIHRFDNLQTVERVVVLQRLGKSTLVGQHGYMQAPLVMAADIAADFKNAASIDEKSKSGFLIDDDTEMRRANETAAKWVADELGTKAAGPIGVIVLRTPRPSVTGTGETAIYDAMFVLCKGEEVSPNEFKITTLIFGSPIAQTNP